ncbi:MAG: response regulator [Butyrivibrio sp.]|uniref:HD-GYP domain-containing protein n=1 Tax=Butyrivibrio sp. TaxID=28121 RepID=UPI001B6D3B7F|nr:HD domain-containing phosphohydrolase [Butyrivibrio sp.]MBP3783047.1 response regulator [Butyrivibrio sp.]
MKYKVAIVDDDVSIITLVRGILGKEGMAVAPLTSGKALLDYIRVQTPDILLLDVMMPDMDGIETYMALRDIEKELGKEEIPVIFLTGNENGDIEEKALELGAKDFIRKPFVPKILALRVTHCIELNRLQKDLASEVEKKSRQNEELFLGIVKSLAAAIDAKDTYTNGHSVRVADYSAEIARRAGYDVSALQRIYITGLLHDVGKIGIPDAIINKNGKLDDEEYAIIKTHPEKGAAILSNIQDMPELSIGARWHHERFDGKGYPEGLMGEDIPEMARIIAIADAYDAMTSNRSYRRSLPQEVVRAEIEKGKGTQFDPIFAEIMLQMIDEDTNYNMRDKGL